jgi:hypothetical protein
MHLQLIISRTHMRVPTQDKIFSRRLHLTIYVFQTLCVYSELGASPTPDRVADQKAGRTVDV